MIEIPEKLRNMRFIKTKEKIPFELDWVKRNNYDYNIFKQYSDNNTTYGILCGINNLLVLDIDKKEVQDELMQIDLFKNTFIVKTAGKGLYHFYFISDIPPNSFKCLDNEKNTLLDAQGIGKQVIGPGSTLTNGKAYEVVNDVPIQKITYDSIRKLLSKYDSNLLESNIEEIKKEYNPNNKDNIIDEIKSKMNVKDLLNKLNISTRKNPTECPFHSSKGGKCFSFTNEVWYCFHCEEKGDLIHLYEKAYNVDFIKAKEELCKLLGINKEKKPTKEEIKQKESKAALEEYENIDVKQFILYKSKDETIYKIFISNFYITLTPDTILGSGDFRKKYFNEVGYLLKGINTTDWIELVNKWMSEKGTIIDNTKDVNTEHIIKETILSEIQNFAVVNNTIDSTSYGRVLYSDDEPNKIFVCNHVLEAIIRKNQFKITLSKIKVLLDEYVEGKSKVIRSGKKLYRYFRFKLEMLPDLEFDKSQFDIQEEKKDDN